MGAANGPAQGELLPICVSKEKIVVAPERGGFDGFFQCACVFAVSFWPNSQTVESSCSRAHWPVRARAAAAALLRRRPAGDGARGHAAPKDP